MMNKKTGINWVAIDEAVGSVTPIHPLAIVADWINDNSTSIEHDNQVWAAAAELVDSGNELTVAGAKGLEELTGVRAIVWLHLWAVWEVSTYD